MIPEYKIDQELFNGETKYERYTVIDSRYNNRLARILYTDNKTAAQSGLPFDDNPEMLFDYNERFMELIKGLKPKSLLILGGGAFTLPMQVHKRYPKTVIDVYEIDGELIKISENYFGLKQDSLLKIHIGDARDLLRRTKTKYDLIIVDVFDSTDIPEAFNQPALPAELKDRLTEKGIVAMNVIGAYHGARAEVLKQLEESFKEVFESVKVFPAGSALSLWISQNFIVIAGHTLKKIDAMLSYKSI